MSQPAWMGKVYKPVSKGAPLRCIDGRSPAILNKSSNLGPQVAGGGPGFSLAWHCATTKPADSVQADFSAFCSAHKASGDPFKLGGHTDDHAQAPFCGCGAIDKMPEILARMTDAASRIDLEKNVQAILGEHYSQDVLQKCLKTLAGINAKRYFKDPGYRQALLKEVTKRSGDGAVQELSGPHKETAVAINQVKSSTLDKDALAVTSASQAFNYDVWYTLQLATRLFKNKDARLKFITTNVAYNVATAMVLTDGSLPVAVRS